jgi:hypothetical protein
MNGMLDIAQSVTKNFRKMSLKFQDYQNCIARSDDNRWLP